MTPGMPTRVVGAHWRTVNGALAERVTDTELAAPEDQDAEQFDRRTWAALAWADACTRAHLGPVPVEFEDELARHYSPAEREDLGTRCRCVDPADGWVLSAGAQPAPVDARTALIARRPVKHATVRAPIGLSGMAEPHRTGTLRPRAPLARVVNCACGTDRTKIPLFYSRALAEAWTLSARSGISEPNVERYHLRGAIAVLSVGEMAAGALSAPCWSSADIPTRFAE
jgi:hypothetical protein